MEATPALLRWNWLSPIRAVPQLDVREEVPLPSQPLPRLPRVFPRDGLDWRAIRSRILGTALTLGLATKRPPLATPPPLFPGVGETVSTWVNRPREETPEITVEGQDLGRAAVRLGVLSVGTVVGTIVILTIGMILSGPALSSARALFDVHLDVPEEASLPELEERSTIYDGDNNLLAVIDREVSRRTIALDQIPKHVQQAVITAEDRKFYEHEGYDVEGIGRAVVANLKAGELSEGGSTITQQLAKSEVGSDKTFERKASELLYAMALEERFTKDELLQRYLNQVYFGSRAYGVYAAAEEFFHRRPDELTVVQGALLASLIRAPNSADPRDKPELALRRRNDVLTGMVEEGYLEPERLPKLLERPLGVKESSPDRKRRQPHVIDAVQRELMTIEVLGKTRKARQRALYYGGLRITTTLDLEMQRTATATIRQYTTGAPTAAIATVDPATGEIKAIASGLDYKDLEYDLPTQGRRQPGSAFKPFIYARALQDGFPPGMSLDGKSPAYFEGVPGWERDCDDVGTCGVSNYGGASYGRMDMPAALRNSVNTAAAQLTIILGADKVADLAGRMNIDIKAATNGKVTQSLGLGGLDQGVTPLEMAAAYSVFANEGKRMKPHLIERVEDREGNVIYQASNRGKRVLHPAVSSVMVDMMRGVVTGGTGTGAALPSWPVAGKTGTTTSNVDAWFVGYTPVLSTAVWVGHSEGQIAMPGMTGGALPATIWRTYMTQVLEGRDVESFPAPDLAGLAARQADGGSVTVPDVTDLTETEALTLLGRRKLIGEARQEASSAPAGTVLWQSPSAGSNVPPGETVYVGVSTGFVPPPKGDGDGDGGGDEGADDGGEDGGEDEEAPPPEEEEPPPPEEELPPPVSGGEDEGDGNNGGGNDDKPAAPE